MPFYASVSKGITNAILTHLVAFGSKSGCSINRAIDAVINYHQKTDYLYTVYNTIKLNGNNCVEDIF